MLLAWAGLCLACGSRAGPPAALDVEYGRCYEVDLPGPVCVLRKDRRINVWLKDHLGERAEIRAGGQLLKAAAEEVRRGRRYRLEIPPGATSLSVSLPPRNGRPAMRWSLALRQLELPAWDPEIRALISGGRRKEARQRLTALLRQAAPKERGTLLWFLVTVAYLDANWQEAEDLLRDGITEDRSAGSLSGVFEKEAMLAGLLTGQGDFRGARQILEGLKPPPEASAESKYLVAFHRGVLASRTGDYREALRQIRNAVEWGDKVYRPDFRWKAEQVEASLLLDLGRTQEADALFERLQDEPWPERECDRGDLLINRAWAWLLAREAGGPAKDPEPILERARDVYESDALCTPQQRLNADLNLALAYQQSGRWLEARRSLDRARQWAATESLRERLWRLDLEGREAIAEGDPARALGPYGELERLAERSLSLDGRFRATFGRARAQLRLGQRSAALRTLEQADHLIDEEAWHVPAYEGRDTLVATREAATKLYLKLLLEERDRRTALALVRRARSRLLRQLTVRDRLAQLDRQEQERWDLELARYRAVRDAIDRQAAEEWQLPGNQRKLARESRAEQLAKAREDLDQAVWSALGFSDGAREGRLVPPGPGEILLAYHPLPDGQWAGFAADERRIEVSRFDLPGGDLSPGALASRLLAPFHSALARAERVRVLPYGRLRSVDFHVLPFEGEPLLARRLVVFGLDLPVRPAPVPPGGGLALLVSDPRGDLKAAREEAGLVAKALRGWGPGWTLERLEGAAARAEAVRPALSRAALFHYAGHGTFAGFTGWDSVLELAEGTRLTLGDLQALGRAPTWVVLSSCEAGRSSGQAPGEGIGLANAFLLAGSEAVVAATRRVPDETARDLMRELYSGWKGTDLPRRFQRAQWACLQSHPAGAGCESFRLLEP